MEWSKIDKDWKKQVDKRTIAPSAAAWDKLAKQLEHREQKVKTLAYKKWIGVAACLIVGGILGLIFLQIEHIIQKAGPKVGIEEYQVVEIEKPLEEVQERREERVVPIQLTKPNQVQRSDVEVQLATSDIQITKPIEYKTERVDSLIIDEIWVRKPQQKVMVDSQDLLKQVEGEIEVEYRETKVNKLIHTAKKAVVDISDSRYEK